MLPIIELKKEGGHLNFFLDGMIKFLCMLKFWANNLNVILGMGKSIKDMKGIAYTSE